MTKEHNQQAVMDMIAEVLRRERERKSISEKYRQDEIKEKIKETWQAKALRVLFRYVRPIANWAWRVLVWTARKVCWLLMPIMALAVTEVATSGISLDGHGELAIAVAYILAVYAGFKAAYKASSKFRAYAQHTW